MSLHNVDTRCKNSEQTRYHQENKCNLDVSETSRKSKVTEKAKLLKNVKSEPLDFDSGGINEYSNTRICLEKSKTPVPVKSVVSTNNVKVEAPDSDSDGNQEISERCSKRPRLEVSNTPQMLKSSLVKEKNKVNRTSRSILKKGIDEPNKYSHVLPRGKNGMKNKVNVKAAHDVPSTSNVLFSKRKGFKVLHSSRCRPNREALSIHMDETYEAFLNLAVVSGDQLIYTSSNGTNHIFEEDMQNSSDSEPTILDNNQRDGYRPSYGKTRAATNKILRKNVMRRKMSCPETYQDTSSDADLNQQDSHQQGDYPALYVRENFEVFKTFIELDGKSLIYKRSNGGRKIYEEVQTTSDAETIVRTNARDRDPLDSSPTMDTDTGHSVKSRNQFREGLMKDLGRPYNQEEYLELLEDACKLGPSDCETDLFKGMESCQTPREYGKSYLEVYKDLAEKINSANGNRSGTLYLLRGLFYWLRNMAEEGSFIPWKDKRCLKALPQPEENRDQPSYKRRSLR